MNTITDKSHVSMEQHVCPVCNTPFDTGTILLDKRLRDSMDRYTITGVSFCPEHAKLRDDGYIALVEAKTTDKTAQSAKLDDVTYTGKIAHIKESAFSKVFNVPVPEKAMMFVEPGVIERLQAMQEH